MINFGYGVCLRKLDSEDIGLIRNWRNNPLIYKWCRQNDAISDVEQVRWFESQSKDTSIKMYMITDFDSRSYGVCGLTSIDHVNRRAEFSLYLGTAHWGQGLGSKALNTLLSHGFRNLGLNCIWGETFDGNPAAKMFEALGFKKEGTRREHYFRDGKFIDAHLYSLLAKERIG